MSMEITGSYSNYASSYTSEVKTQQTGNSGKTSKTTQEYLSELKEKYPNVNITVVDFGSEKQKLSYMMGSSGNNNVAISSTILEQMAENPETAAKYEKLIAEVPNDAKETEQWAKEHNQIIYGSGMVIDKNGKVTYWMVGGEKETRENPGTVYKERVQKWVKERQEQKKLAEKKAAKEKAEESLKEHFDSRFKGIAVTEETQNKKSVSRNIATKSAFVDVKA